MAQSISSNRKTAQQSSRAAIREWGGVSHRVTVLDHGDRGPGRGDCNPQHARAR